METALITVIEKLIATIEKDRESRDRFARLFKQELSAEQVVLKRKLERHQNKAALADFVADFETKTSHAQPSDFSMVEDVADFQRRY